MKHLRLLRYELPPHANSWISSIAFRPDGLRLAAQVNCSLREFDVRNGIVTLEEQFHRQAVCLLVPGVAYSPNGRLLAAGWKGFTVVLDAASDEVRMTWQDKGCHFRSMAFSPDSSKLAIGKIWGDLEVWDTRSWEVQCGTRLEAASLDSIAFSPDGKEIACGGQLTGMAIEIRSAADLAAVRSIQGRDWIARLRYARGGTAIFGTNPCHLVGFDPITLSPLIAPGSVQGGPYALDASADGEWLATQTGPTSIGIISARSGKIVREWRVRSRRPDLDFTGLAFSAGGKLLASCSQESIDLWELDLP